MIQLALRSSVHADVPLALTRSSRIDGSATAVIINSRPARNTPAPKTASSTSLVPRSIVEESSRAGPLTLRSVQDAEVRQDDHDLPVAVIPDIARIRPVTETRAERNDVRVCRVVDHDARGQRIGQVLARHRGQQAIAVGRVGSLA